MTKLPTPEAETSVLEVYDLIEKLLSPNERIIVANKAFSEAIEEALRKLYVKAAHENNQAVAKEVELAFKRFHHEVGINHDFNPAYPS